MKLLDLLDHLDDHGVALELHGDRIRATGPRHAIEAVSDDLRAHRDLLHAHLVGVYTGHLLAFCEECNAPTVTAVKKPGGGERTTWPTCRDRPGCGGRTQHSAPKARCHPRPVDLDARGDAPAPPTATRQPPKADRSRLLGPHPPWPEP